MNPKADILIVDDERHTREALMRYLRTRFTVTGAEDGAQAIDLLRTHDYDLVLTDLRMPGADGMSVLEAALAKGNHPACIVFTAYGTIEAAVAAVKAGAFDFVAKPVRLDRLDEVVNAALKHRAARRRTRRRRRPRRGKTGGSAPRRHRHRRLPGDAAGGRTDPAGGAEPRQHHAHRRERHRQGGHRARDPRRQRPQGALRAGALRGAPRESP